MNEIGVVCGRFQPFHLGHLDYILKAKAHCRSLLIGITNPDPSSRDHDAASSHRATSAANPFTYYERMFMINKTMISSGINRGEFEIIPFPINFPERLKYYAPPDAVYFITVFDNWGSRKVELLQSQGIKKIDITVEKNENKPTSGTEVRNLIATRKEWEHLVPISVRDVIYSIGIESVISRINNEN